MHLAILPESHTQQRLPYYLAAEEWIAHNIPDDCFFAWQVDPTVICGRNQDVESEVDLDFCRRNGIEVYRRKSGGGAVFADRNNIMFSYVTAASSVADAFGAYTAMVAGALRGLGLDASASGRNDILIGDRKVAGNACLRCAARSIVHGTMLFDADPAMMGMALTPGRSKLASHKVKSVAARITTVREYLPDLDIHAFLKYMTGSLCSGSIVIPDEALPAIKEAESSYYDEDFIGKGRAVKQKRIDGVGSIGIASEAENGKLSEVHIRGDFFAETDVASVARALHGERADAESIAARLGDKAVIAGLDNRTLAEMIAESAKTEN